MGNLFVVVNRIRQTVRVYSPGLPPDASIPYSDTIGEQYEALGAVVAYAPIDGVYPDYSAPLPVRKRVAASPETDTRKRCADCGTPIHKTSTHCNPCAYKHRMEKRGKKPVSPVAVVSKPKTVVKTEDEREADRRAYQRDYQKAYHQEQKHPCADCGVLVYRKALRCKPCANKRRKLSTGHPCPGCGKPIRKERIRCGDCHKLSRKQGEGT